MVSRGTVASSSICVGSRSEVFWKDSPNCQIATASPAQPGELRNSRFYQRSIAVSTVAEDSILTFYATSLKALQSHFIPLGTQVEATAPGALEGARAC